MSKEGRMNTILGIACIKSIFLRIKNAFFKAASDGKINKKEALEILEESTTAIIEEGSEAALTVAERKRKVK